MAIDGYYDSQEAAPEWAREHLVKEGDKFRLDINGYTEGEYSVAFENVSGLRSALESERNSNRELTRKLKPFEGIDDAWLTQARAAIEAAEANGTRRRQSGLKRRSRRRWKRLARKMLRASRNSRAITSPSAGK